MNELMKSGSSILEKAGFTQSVSLTAKESEESTGIKASKFFPFIQLIQRMSKDVGDSISPGDFLLKIGGKDTSPKNLTRGFNAFVIAVRGKAVFFDGDTVVAKYDTIVRGERKKSPGYDDFREEAHKDFSMDNPYKIGLDVLMWLPDLGAFATLFGNSTSMISAIETNIAPYCADPAAGSMGTSVLINSAEKQNKKGRWFVINAEPTTDDDWNWPTPEMYIDALTMFVEPPEEGEGLEKAEEGKKRSR